MWFFQRGVIAAVEVSGALVFLLTSVQGAKAAQEGDEQPWVGLSAFAIQSSKFQASSCTNFINAVYQSRRPAIAVLFETFGKSNRCLKEYWNESRKRAVPQLTEIHFSNEAGRRMKLLDKFDLMPNLDVDRYNLLLEEMPAWFETKLRERVRRIVALTTEFADTGEFILSTGLEDNYSMIAWLNLYAILREEWPGKFVRNSMYQKRMREQTSFLTDKVFLEYHGYDRKMEVNGPCVANGDGHDMAFLTGGGLNFRDLKAASRSKVRIWLERSKAKGCITLLWAGKWQGFFTEKGVPRPLKRKPRFDVTDIAAVRDLLQ